VCPGDSSIHPQGGEDTPTSERALTQEGRGTCVCLSCRLACTYDISPPPHPLCKHLRVWGGLEELGAGIGGLHPLSGARELRRAVDAAASQDVMMMVMMVMMVRVLASVASCT
jgi:hypothetical protein